MTADKPLISVILPVYNGEKYLAEALQSVYEQDYDPMEIIVIDDGSTDNTAKILAGYTDRIHYAYQENRGPAAARNYGLQLARGKFIAFIDADDLWPTGKLNFQMDVFLHYQEAEIVQGLVRRIQLINAIGKDNQDEEDPFEFVNSNLGAMIMRQSVFDHIGNFNESLTYHSDTDFWFRAREAGIKIFLQKKIALIYRIHSANHTIGKNTQSLGFAKILKLSIDRRRKESGEIAAIPELPVIPEEDSQSFQRSNNNVEV